MMKHDEFIGQVQHRSQLGSRGEAAAAVRATLETLAERLAGEAADNLASQLPPEIGRHLRHSPDSKRLDIDQFFERISEREGIETPVAIHHARAVLDVLEEAVSEGQMEKIYAQLPDEFAPVFEAGSEGEMDIEDE